jgi:putative Ca2+/H+ antiporter (TMEM165/GDT1 family)
MPGAFRRLMDALMTALVFGAICQAGDKTPWLAAILADRYRTPTVVILATALALAGNYALGVIAGMLIAPMITPEAKLLLLALALLLAGVGTTFRSKSPERLEGWRLGAFGTSALGLAIMIFGDRMQFIVAALAARSDVPWLAAVGATLGAIAVAVPAALVGERRWLALPQRAIRIGTAAVLVLFGVIFGLMALRLV